MSAHTRPRRRWPLGLALVLLPVALVAAGVVAVARSLSGSRPIVPVCTVAGTVPVQLSIEQAANATTIAAVAKTMNLPDHAVTVAVAAAFQESHLRNLGHGDLDSLGLFQQRPSQGWGTPAQILTPSYAARTFYQHLARLPDWQSLSVTDAAQAVQRSAAPDAYAAWEAEARTVAQALTGEVPAGLSCHFAPAAGAPQSDALSQAITDELGQPALATPVATARGWTVATWLVGHAQRFALRSVSFSGQTWTAGQGRWHPDAGAGPTVTTR